MKKARTMVCAFWTYENDVLLIHRGLHKKIAPGQWSGIGGHVEPEEINDPHSACLRETFEEAGIEAKHIERLSVRYLVVRDAGDEIRVTYFFIGHVKEKVELPHCDEGSLHWVRKEDGATLNMTDSVKCTYLHWLAHPQAERVYLLGMDAANQNGTWVEL